MKKKFVYKQLNIEKALKGKDEIYEEPSVDDSEDGFKSVSLFDFINDIRKYKKGDLLDEETSSTFNPFMILKFLSAKEEDIPICNYLNKYQNTLSKEQFYNALLLLIEKDFGFYKSSFKKEEKNDTITYVAKYFDCSYREAEMYTKQFGEKWAECIKNKFTMKEG